VRQRLQSQITGLLAGVSINSDGVHIWPGGERRCRCNYLVFQYFLIFLFGLLSACSEPIPDETLLREAVAEMEKAAEAREAGPILAYLADDFIGNQVLRKANIRAILLLQFRQNQHVQVLLRITELHISAQQAQITCHVLLVGRDGEIVPERGRVLVIQSNWQKRDDQWKLVRAQWQDPLLQP